MFTRNMVVAIALAFLAMPSAADAGEVIINYEFSDEPHQVVNVSNLLSSSGAYWNRVGSSFFATQSEFSGAVRDEFGEIIPPPDPLVWPPNRQVPRLRTRIVNQAPVVSSPLVTQDPGLGSLVFEGQNLVEIFDMLPDARYDVVVHYQPLSPNTGTIRLSDLLGNPIADPSLVTSPFGGAGAALFTDVRPIEMHIGPPGAWPLGVGVGYYSDGSTTPSLVEIRGIQIRGSIPEPSTILLTAIGVAAFAGFRCRK